MSETVEVTAAAAVEEAQINLRQNFNALAVFAASLPTDAAGRAQVRVKLPDNLTRYRVMAVSVAGGRLAGTGESAITARLPLMARPSAPRFLNFGDRAELPVVVQNQTDSAMSVGVAVRAINAELTEGAGRRVTRPRKRPRRGALPRRGRQARHGALPGGGRRRPGVGRGRGLAARLHAGHDRGLCHLRRDRRGRDRAARRAPADVVRTVRRAGSDDRVDAAAGADRRRHLPLQLPVRVHRAGRLARHRHRRAQDVLAAFNSRTCPRPTRCEQSVAAATSSDFKRLQNDDGGFPFWRRGEESNPYVTVHVAHALVRARRQGLRRARRDCSKSRKRYLDDIERHIPDRYTQGVRSARFALTRSTSVR